MTTRIPAALAALLLLGAAVHSVAAQPLALHPENPHYFLYKGKPLVIITSAEHYGAVLNLDFDYVPYLNELRSKNLNNTRTFSGAYVEPQGAFNIAQNTLAPAPERFISPWARSSTPGYANGGNKFDLTQWDAAYFKRLKDFVAQAEKRDIIVEMNLFCPFYEEPQWKLSPQNAINNVNGIGDVSRTNVYTLDKHGGLLAVHEALVRKLVTELNGYDNVYYEICNEPYFGGVTMEWQHRMVDVIVETEKKLRNQHLISLNIANGSARITNAHPAVSIFNFHYATPPTTVALNYALNKPIGDNETGFRGTNNLPYRVEAWEFIMAGGALFNHLDYSFTAQHEDGTFVYPASQPGGGNAAIRNEMKILREFIQGFNFVEMKPNSSFIERGVPSGATARGLMDEGKAYALYIGPTPVPKDLFSVRWTGKIEPKTSDTYTFHAMSNDGVRLWIDGKLLIENWTEHSATEDSAAIPLKAGQKYDMRVDYYQSGGGAVMKLSWSSSTQEKQIIPPDRLSTPDGRGRGMQARYYTGKNFDRLQMSRIDRTIDFDWTERSPFERIVQASETNQIANLTLKIPPGSYTAEWLNTKTGQVDKREPVQLTAGLATLASPPYSEDIALRIMKKK